MKLGYAHQSTGGLAVAQAVKELLGGERERIRFVIARKPIGAARGVLLGMHEFALVHMNAGYTQQVRYVRGDSDEFGSHMAIGFGPNETPDPVVVAAVLTEQLYTLKASLPGADLFRPLDEVNPDHPVFGAFEV